MSKIYLASSWRNEHQPALVNVLRAAGHEVYDFRNPPGGIQNGFRWSEIDPDWMNWTAGAYRQALHSPLAQQGFDSDFNGMKWADTGVLLLPCGRSAHLELGWMAGAGKRTIIVTEDGQEPELMAKLANHVVVGWDELVALLNATVDQEYGSDDVFSPAFTMPVAPYQERVGDWMMQCFGTDMTNSLEERCYRFFEEAGELCQALGMTAEKAHALVDYVYGRPVGDPAQEVGGTMVCLAALCFAAGMDMKAAGNLELARISDPTIMDKIRRKHADKVLHTPHSALPGDAGMVQS